jgi:iron complex outermembrane receptor protein
MTFTVSRHACLATKPLAMALAISAAFSSSTYAQTPNDQMLEPIVITGARFASVPGFAPIGASVITAEQIQEAGIDNVNEAIRKIGGVYGRQSLSGNSDFSLDLRGFGSSSDQNIVVLIDGIRLSENELATAVLSSIPIESVDRVEIVRGGSSVLYGEGATGGTIQIITKRAALNKLRGTVVAEFGSYGDREVRASVAKGWDAFSLDANLSSQRKDNYRANSDLKQDNFSGGMQWATKEGKVGLRIDAARQDSRLPGSLTLAQFESDPRQATTPNDFGSVDTNRYTLFADQRWGDLEVAAELSHRDKTAKATFISSFGTFTSQADSRVTQFSPRVRYLTKSGDTANELVAGVDLSRWTRLTDSVFGGFPSSQADASQTSRAVYARDEVRLGALRVALGARHETFDKDSVDPVPFTSNTYSKNQSLNAWELQANYTVVTDLDLFAKAGQSYRVANVDENGATPIPNQPLDPQRSHDLTLGTTYGHGDNKVTVQLFQHRLRDEIFYDPTAGAFGANVNLDPTKRAGIELEASARLMSEFALTAHVQHVNAEFTDGPNDGHEMVLVPRNSASAWLNWVPGDGQSANVGMQWVDTQRYGGDFSNACSSRMPSFATLDARYARQFGGWEIAISGSNLTDKKYFTNAFGACNSGIYPDSGRQLKLSARYNF